MIGKVGAAGWLGFHVPALVWAGLAFGVVLFSVDLLVVGRTVRQAPHRAEEGIPRYLATRYWARYAALLLLLGAAVWVTNDGYFVAGAMAGMLLAKLAFLIVGGSKTPLLVRWLSGAQRPGHEHVANPQGKGGKE